jgi:hypothetical protein
MCARLLRMMPGLRRAVAALSAALVFHLAVWMGGLACVMPGAQSLRPTAARDAGGVRAVAHDAHDAHASGHPGHRHAPAPGTHTPCTSLSTCTVAVSTAERTMRLASVPRAVAPVSAVAVAPASITFPPLPPPPRG